MADMQRLIETILSDTKFDPAKNAAARIYRDQPILRTATEAAKFTPPKYRAMRKLAYKYYQEPEERIFYEQARFMEDFEDDYNFQGEFKRYFPSYGAMSDAELRGYFSWRTRVRRGRIERTSFSFVFVYIYELLNQIGVDGPEAGFRQLRRFWIAYQEFEPKIDSYLRPWLRDYVVYNNLDRSLLAGWSDDDYDQASLTLLNYESSGRDEIFQALSALSAYDLGHSRFFKQHPEEVRELVHRVFVRLSEHYRKSAKGFCEKFFGRVYAYPYFMFKSALFYDQKKRADFIYEITDIYKYKCLGGAWSCERFSPYQGKLQKAGALLKTIDFLMRQHFGFKSTLKAPKISQAVQGLISREIEKYRAERKAESASKIEIDLSQLQGIRQAALATQSKLIVEEIEFEEPGPPDVKTSDDKSLFSAEAAGPENDPGLSRAESLFLRCLLYGRDFKEFVRTEGLMLSVLVDAINESLFDRFDDTVIIYDGEQPELVEDYLDDLKRMCPE